MDPETGRLLVVDDNEMNRDMLSRRLARKGYEVALAEDGAAALAAVEKDAFDLILLDIMMPGIDGFEVLERLREKYPPTKLPIVMATAKGEREDIVKALKLGANDYVTKPLDFPVVLARIRTQLTVKRSVERIVALQGELERKNEELEAANQRMKKDLRAAAQVQQSLLPTAVPNTADVEFAWIYRPCDELAGDILNVFPLDEQHVGLYLLDVAGHGVQAALLAVALSRMLTPVADQSTLVRRRIPGGSGFEPTPPGEVAAELNRRFPLDPETGQYFTAYYAVLNTRTHELRSICAGHPAPLHLSASGATEVLKTSSFAIGWVPDADFEEKRLQLSPGDRLVLYSDGINEAKNADREQFGVERVVSRLLESRDVGLRKSLENLVASAEAWSGQPLDDDVSLLAIEIKPPRDS